MNRNRAPAKLWQTTTFRMAMVFAAVFGIGAALLLVVLDVAVGPGLSDVLNSTERESHRMSSSRPLAVTIITGIGLVRL